MPKQIKQEKVRVKKDLIVRKIFSGTKTALIALRKPKEIIVNQQTQ